MAVCGRTMVCAAKIESAQDDARGADEIGRARPLARPMADSDDEVLELDLPPVESIIRLSDGRLGHVQSHTPSGTHMLVSDENGDESLLTADDGWTLEDLRVEQRS